MTKLERIKKLLESEHDTIARTNPEITVDFDAVKAELRAKCLEDVLKILES